jgi:hypothetical protein
MSHQLCLLFERSPLLKCTVYSVLERGGGAMSRVKGESTQSLGPITYRNSGTLITRRSRYSSVVQCWATGWMIGGLSPGRGWEFFSSPPRPDRLWGPPSPLSNGYLGLLPWG